MNFKPWSTTTKIVVTAILGLLALLLCTFAVMIQPTIESLVSNLNVLTIAIGVAFFAVGAWLGGRFPDIDYKVSLDHRSIVTHGFLMPALLLIGVGMTRLEWADWFVAGFSAGVAVHLAFDLFPKGWKGFALIKVPIFGPLSKAASAVWLFVNMFLCMFMSVYISLARGPASVIICGVILVGLGLYYVVKKEPILGALLYFGMLSGLLSLYAYL